MISRSSWWSTAIAHLLDRILLMNMIMISIKELISKPIFPKALRFLGLFPIWTRFILPNSRFKGANWEFWGQLSVWAHLKTRFVFHIDRSFRMIFMIRNSIGHSKFEILGRNFEFWDELYNYTFIIVNIITYIYLNISRPVFL